MENSREKVIFVLTRLQQEGVTCHLFGGWAEEVLGLREPSPHTDIDMLHCDENFDAFDRMLRNVPEFGEVSQKRFHHKRAFSFAGTLCECILVTGTEERPLTLFWGDVPFAWQSPLLHSSQLPILGEPVSVVSAVNLKWFRKHHRETQPHRWREQRWS